jgi:hypothetical protein
MTDDDVRREGQPDLTPQRLEATADHLAEATLSLDRLNYNVLTPDELQAVLEARERLQEICLRYRQQQPRTREGDE